MFSSPSHVCLLEIVRDTACERVTNTAKAVTSNKKCEKGDGKMAFPKGMVKKNCSRQKETSESQEEG